MKSLSINCPQLLKIDLRGCKSITNSTINYLAKGCSELNTINLYSCPNITKLKQGENTVKFGEVNEEKNKVLTF
jgi:hypothetical protein